MKQPKKLHEQLEYSDTHALPDIDSSLKDFISVYHENLGSHILHSALEELGAEHVGEFIYIDDTLDESQFEENASPDFE